MLQIVRELYFLLGYSLGIARALLQSVVAELICSTEMVKIELCASANSSALFHFGILEDVTLRIVKVLTSVERCCREEDCLRVLPLVLCLRFKFRLHFVCVMAQCLHKLGVYLAKLREAGIISRSKSVSLLRQHSACSISYVTWCRARMTRFVFVLYTFHFLAALSVKPLTKAFHLLIVLVRLLQSQETVVLASVRHHVVLHTACCLRTILVLHDTVALVVYHSVPLGFQQFLIHAEVSECGYHYALTALCSSSSATLLSPVVKVANLHIQVASVLYPVAHLLLARGHNKYTSLALLHKSLGNAKSRKCLARTRAVGEHVALAISVLSVCMLIAEELRLRSQYVFLLLG